MEGLLRILHLEDDPRDAELIQENLVAEGFACDVARVQTREEFLAAVERGHFNIILADFSLPSFDGLSALIIAQEKCPDVPFIFVSGAIGEEMAIETLRKGATDYVLKHRLSRLGPAVERALKEVEERNRRQQATEELRQSQSQLEAILQGITEGITVQTPDGRLLYANQAAAELSGYTSPEEFLATPLPEVMARFELLDEQGQPFPAGRLPGRLALQGERASEVLLRWRIRETGVERWTIVSASPVYDPQGHVQFAINIFRDITERMRMFEAERIARAQAEAAQQRLEFLSRASRILARSLDYQTTLRRMARLAVPWLADWCAVDLVQENGATSRVAVAHVDPARAEVAYELERRFPREPDAQRGLPYVLRTGRSELYPEVPDDLLEKMVRTSEHLELIRQLGFQSCIVVPLKVRDQVIGALTLVTAASGRRYGEEELALAEELAQRAAVAVDNARLYREATLLNEELEQRVARRTEELQVTNARLEAKIHEHQQAEMRFRSLLESAPDAMVIVNQNGEIGLVNSQTEALFGYTRAELLGQTVETLLPEPLRQRPVSHRDSYHREPHLRPMGGGLDLYGLRRDGSRFPVEISLSPLTTDEGTLVIAAVRDVTERNEAVETTRALLRLSEKINATLDPEALLDTLLEEAITLTRTESGFAGINTAEGMVTRKHIHKGHRQAIDYVWPPGYGIPGWLLENKKPYLTNDANDDEQIVPEFRRRFSTRSLLSTPILNSNGDVLGFFEVNNKQDGADFTEKDRQKLVGVSQIAAIALQNAQSYRRLQELSRQVVSAQEEERQRLSRELHDSAGQLLTALHINLGLLADEGAEGSELREQITEAAELARIAHEEIRAASHALRPPALDTLGLNETLKALCRDFARQANLKIAYEGADVPPISEQASISFYRFLQEALTNVARHARANTVQVTLSNDGDELRLSVQDNGVGMLALNHLFATGQTGGVGLLGLRERFELIGGKVAVESWPEKGTRVAAQYRLKE